MIFFAATVLAVAALAAGFAEDFLAATGGFAAFTAGLPPLAAATFFAVAGLAAGFGALVLAEDAALGAAFAGALALPVAPLRAAAGAVVFFAAVFFATVFVAAVFFAAGLAVVLPAGFAVVAFRAADAERFGAAALDDRDDPAGFLAVAAA